MKSALIIRTAAAAAILFGLVHAGAAAAQTYRPGDRVQCNVIGSNAPQYEKYYENGTVQPFNPGDGPDGSWYPVKADSNGVAYPCKVAVIRPVREAPAAPAGPAAAPRAAAPAPQQAALPAGGFLQCPVQQPKAQNGAAPNPELIKRLIRCAKGEKAVAAGQEGAVKVDVASVQVGAARAWSYRQDSGNGQVGTRVWPVRATYDVSTLYRAATEVEQGWIRVLNLYVDPFGEWKIGSEETVKAGVARRINR